MKVKFRAWDLNQARRQSARHFTTSQPCQKARQRRSQFWIPQATLTQQNEATPDANQLLVRAGYFRQAYAGIFHMLPLGLRVQAKIEALVDKHMRSLNASKVSLSSISSQQLWQRSGRYRKDGEFFSFKDRKDAGLILAPTHEEEITSLVKELVYAPGHLPIRLYQISRKYRDEKRPRGGLLRGREFIMKDLYTFDRSEADAHVTYNQVREAYTNLFDELKLPYIEARADSGNMGGNLSHEFHFPSNLGEDDIITCSNCEYAKNEEFVPEFKKSMRPFEPVSGSAAQYDAVSQSFISRDRRTLIKAFAAGSGVINPFAVKDALKDHAEVDTGVEDAEAQFSPKAKQSKAFYLFDHTFSDEAMLSIANQDAKWLQKHKLSAFTIRINDDGTSQNHLLKKQTGDACPDCAAAGRDGRLTVRKAIEVGHTFHLGARYSSKLDLVVPGQKQAFVSMGCHGIGVSRLIAAVASALSDTAGLMWPRAIAPFEILVVINPETADVGNEVYDELAQDADVLIDDRQEVSFGWKLKDADLIGYPVIVVIGKGWLNKKTIEVQCRRLEVKEEMPLEKVAGRVRELLNQL